MIFLPTLSHQVSIQQEINLASKKKQLQKLQKEVGKAMPKSTQTRVVEMITYNRHPYITYTLQLHENIVMVKLCMCV